MIYFLIKKGMNMNEALIKVFSDLAFYEDFVKRPFPAKAYRNAIVTFKDLNFEIDSVDQVEGLYGIGDGIKKKIDAFLTTGTFPRYEEFKASDASRCMEIAAIKGFGANKARKLYDAGIKSLDELREAVKDLKIGQPIGNVGFNFTKAMKLGLEYEAHTDHTRMTVEEHDGIAVPMMASIREVPGVVECEAVGSRRRYDGSPDFTIGDIDIIISVEDANDIPVLTKELVKMLDEVAMAGATKVSGIKNRRQVDFRIVIGPYGPLKLHATGPASFNVECRRIAMKNDWMLNEYGLFDNRNMRWIEQEDEERILIHLGIGWIEPKDRKNFKRKED